MKSFIVKTKLVLTLFALVAILPIKSFAQDIYEVTASTIIEGNTYTSAPLTVSGPMAFVAQIRQFAPQGAYDFDVKEMPSTNPNQLQFNKTTIGPVTFVITRNGSNWKAVIVQSPYKSEYLNIDELL